MSGSLSVMARRLFAIFALGAVLISLFYVTQLVRQDLQETRPRPRFSISLDEPAPSSSDVLLAGNADHGSLRIAIAPVISPEKSIEIYRGLAHFLARQLGKDAQVLQRGTYAEINELVRDRHCDVALVCTYPFVRGEQDFGMEALVVPVVDGALTYNSLILVPVSSEASSLSDLRDKRFACADLMSSSGWLFPALWLQNRGENPESFFSEIVVAGSHDRSIQAVVSGYVDGAAVHSLVYRTMVKEDPSIVTRTKIIQKSPPYGMPPFVIHPQMALTLKVQLKNALLHMHEDPEGWEILSAIGIDKFAIADGAMYESVRKAVELWESR